MKIVSADLFILKIPFKMSFSHSMADRYFSDSVILKLIALDDSGAPVTGWGEAVIREYVSGSIGSGNKLKLLKEAFSDLLWFGFQELEQEDLLAILKNATVPTEQLPIFCAIETALLDILCSTSSTDIYNFLSRSPEREKITYSGTLPLLPPAAAEKLLNGYKQVGIKSLRIKIGTDPVYNNDMISLSRRILGEHYDLRVDANAGWSIENAEENIPILKRAGISIIEEPFGKEKNNNIVKLTESGLSEGITFMADESVLTVEDIRKAAKENTFGMFNLRLSKNGGLLRTLKMAEEAEKIGLRYQAGCHVGETGILSAVGRLSASLMKNPEYADGSYDSHLLSDNITIKDLSFGKEGRAEIIRGNRLGFTIDQEKLERYTDEKIECF